MLILRLAPQDYHRFHSPVAGRVVDQWANKGTLHSVNQQSMTSSNLAILNQRKVAILETEKHGEVAFISIGAVCVGSVTHLRDIGDNVTKGEEMGYYSFGGSTNVLLFKANTIAFDEDILYRSRRNVETRVEQGQRIGVSV